MALTLLQNLAPKHAHFALGQHGGPKTNWLTHAPGPRGTKSQHKTLFSAVEDGEPPTQGYITGGCLSPEIVPRKLYTYTP